MDKHSITNKVMIRLLMLSVIILFPACVDKVNDWEVDESKAGMFTPVFFETSRLNSTSVELRYSRVPNDRSYIVELSKDSLEFNSIEQIIEIVKEDMLPDDAASSERYLVTISDLDASTRYSARIKSISDKDLPDSKWAAITFRTPSEQIVSSFAYGEDNATLVWEPGLKVTHYIVTIDNERTRTALTPEEIANGEVHLTGLEPDTEYVVSIMNDDKIRGRAAFKTYPRVSGDGQRYYLTGDEDIVEYLKEVTESEVVLVLPAGSSYEIGATWALPAHITSLTLWGLPSATDSQPYLKVRELRFDPLGTGFKVWLQNLYIEGVDGDADYVINDKPTHTRDISMFRMENCTVHSFRGIFRTNGVVTVEDVDINSCVIYNVGNFGIVNGDASSLIKNINIRNSTIYKVKNTHVLSVRTKGSSLQIDHCTFYDILASGRYLIHFNGSGNVPDLLTISNSIFAASDAAVEARGTNPKIESPFVSNSYRTADFSVASGYPLSGISDYLKTSDELFENPAEGNFSIIDITIGGESQPGDPRWW
ncbi:DUF5123 domain-containing protein [Proteiniphilum sp. X52]|uniref:DUF5123 domain-containing protein n=1 Tax=Proteiniphilum sp. X52 TaxID=2382159 RepID=UPI000F0A98DE|nr:DUF5123 domain-containing protein [Proteiniphilum sp. X52]RNC66390.1 DUF5123 domain-containing protein [Proteiniphilum sp. X52]